MTTISERLRLQFGYSPHARNTVPECWQQALTEAADTIDALVAALEEAKEYIRACHGTDDRPYSDCGHIVRQADAALALARK